MNLRHTARVAAIAAFTLIGSATAAWADAGIKFGPTFATFSSDARDFDNRTGLHAGLFFGGNRDGVLGLQSEINWIRKNAETAGDGQDIRIDYLQLPVLLRLNIGSGSASGFRVYGLGGPALDLKLADEVEGVTIDDGWEGADVSLVIGGGVEIARVIVEGRYEKGFRRINKNFFEITEIKKQAFSILFGFRFN